MAKYKQSFEISELGFKETGGMHDAQNTVIEYVEKSRNYTTLKGVWEGPDGPIVKGHMYINTGLKSYEDKYVKIEIQPNKIVITGVIDDEFENISDAHVAMMKTIVDKTRDYLKNTFVTK